MGKYIIVLVVLVLGALTVWFLIQKGGSFSEEFTEVGSNLSITPQTPNVKASAEKKSQTIPSDKKIMSATLHTNNGDIAIEFFRELAPKTVANFVKLAEAGFYDRVKFHRVIKGFMIQSGDPLSKDDSKMALWGTGGPGYSFADELGPGNKNALGTIAMANSGPNTNGSQFFINVAANNFLDGKHTVFGKVVSGMDVVRKIENTPTEANDRPKTPIIIESITLK